MQPPAALSRLVGWGKSVEFVFAWVGCFTERDEARASGLPRRGGRGLSSPSVDPSRMAGRRGRTTNSGGDGKVEGCFIYLTQSSPSRLSQRSLSRLSGLCSTPKRTMECSRRGRVGCHDGVCVYRFGPHAYNSILCNPRLGLIYNDVSQQTHLESGLSVEGVEVVVSLVVMEPSFPSSWYDDSRGPSSFWR